MVTPKTAPDSAQATLLIVEDSAVQRVLLERLVRQAGYRFLSAKDGAEGLAMAQAERPDLIISDIAMPHMDGYEMCRAIKQDPRLRHLPLLLLTGLDDPAEVIHGLGAGADNYLTKPVEDDHLLERIRSLLDHAPDPHEVDTLEEVQISFAGKRHVLQVGRRQTLNLLLSTYENAVRKNQELIQAQTALQLLTDHLEDEVRQRTRQLEVANRLKTEFIANMGHEVRTPMNAIIGMVDLVLESSSLHADDQEMLRIARTASDKLLTLLNSLLDFSLMERGQLALRQEAFALRAALKAHLTPFLGAVVEKGLAFRCLVHCDVPDRLVADFPHLGKILDQLLDNALKFTEQGDIALGITRLAHNDPNVAWVRFTVQDSGIGIVPEHQEWIFDSFSQGDGSKTRKYGGTGLGLALAKRLAEAMQGQLSFHSEPEKGSIFYLDMVMAVAQEGGGEHPTATEEKAPHDGDFLLLLQEGEGGVASADTPTPQGTSPQGISPVLRSNFLRSDSLPGGDVADPDAAAPAYHHRLLQHCERAIHAGDVAETDRLVGILKGAFHQLPSAMGALLSKNVLRMAMAARSGDVATALAHLQRARAGLSEPSASKTLGAPPHKR